MCKEWVDLCDKKEVKFESPEAFIGCTSNHYGIMRSWCVQR